MAKRLLLLRHASTGPANEGRYIGSTDVAADPAGLAQVARLAPLLASYGPGCCLASPMQRARDTAAEMVARCKKISPVVAIDNDLREVDFGQWERRTFSEIVADYPREVDLWAKGGDDFIFPGGESLGGFRNRVSGVAARLAARPEETVLAVTHGGVIRTMLCQLLGLALENYLLFDVRPARLTVVELYDQGGVLVGLNL